MTTKNKKIETRLEPETRAEFERLADDLGVSPYTAVQWAIDCFIDKYNTTIIDVVSSIINRAIERMEKQNSNSE